VLDDAWQEMHMSSLADYVVGLLESSDSVPDYLASHRSEFTTPKLID
jgi:hypothetical protein